MNFDDTVIELFTMFLTVGGLGFINYFILVRLDKININKRNKEDKPLFLLLFSLINYVLYLLTVFLIDYCNIINNPYLKLAISITLTLTVTVFLTFTLFSWLSRRIYDFINKSRTSESKAQYDSKPVRNKVFDYNRSKEVYVYNLNSELIVCGFSGWISSGDEEHFEFSVYPFSEVAKNTSFESVIESINQKQLEAEVYINIDKNVKIIVID